MTEEIKMYPMEVHKRLGVYNSLIKHNEAAVNLYSYSDEKLRKHLKKLCKAQILRYKIIRGTIFYEIKNREALHAFLKQHPIVRDSHVEKILYLLEPTQ